MPCHIVDANAWYKQTMISLFHRNKVPWNCNQSMKVFIAENPTEYVFCKTDVAHFIHFSVCLWSNNTDTVCCERASVIPLTKHAESIIVTIDQLPHLPNVHSSDLLLNNICCLFYHYAIKFASGYWSGLTVTIINEYHRCMLDIMVTSESSWWLHMPWCHLKEPDSTITWWRHEMETLSALLAPHTYWWPVDFIKWPVMRNFGVFFVVKLNKLWNKQLKWRRFETPKRLCDVSVLGRIVAM